MKAPERVAHLQGFSLVETMVAMVAGLTVGGAALAFAMSTIKSNNEFVTATRLTQELRSAVDFVGRDLRRAGFDQAYMSQIALDSAVTTVSPFAPIFVSADSSCVLYAYDRADDTSVATDAYGVVDGETGEIRGIRRVVNADGVGVIEVGTTSATDTALACDDATANYDAYPPACNGGWCPLTDSLVMHVSAMTVTDVSPAVIAPASSTALPLRIREFELNLAGNLIADTSVARGVQSRVRVRAECLRDGMTSADVSACTAAPVHSP